jgi:predicted HAD superfamily Cof-like phosphohydrolase
LSIEQVRHFNTTFGVHMSSTPTTRVPAAGLRYELIREEFEEYAVAVSELDIVEMADALGDILYVAHGAALVFGAGELLTTPHVSGNHGYTLATADGRKELLGDLRYAILWNDLTVLGEVLNQIVEDVYALASGYGIDLDLIVDAIHKSNMSKLGEDGKPIYREGDGKVMKGPDYKTPTDDIRKLVFGDNYAPASE